MALGLLVAASYDILVQRRHRRRHRRMDDRRVSSDVGMASPDPSVAVFRLAIEAKKDALSLPP